jgi:hypothetical protein
MHEKFEISIHPIFKLIFAKSYKKVQYLNGVVI